MADFKETLEKIKNVGGQALNEYKEGEKAKEINKLIPIVIIGSILLFIGGMWFQKLLKK